MADETPRSGGKERSPNFPSLGLPDAIELARKLWMAEKRTTVPQDVAAKALGYGSLSGASRAALAALRQYGLLDGSGDGVSVSNLAVEIAVHSPDSPEWARAVRAAAGYPVIFEEIRETHSDASDAALNAYLITKRRFSVDGAKRFIRSFRETNELVNRVGQGYTEAPTSNATAASEPMPTPASALSAQVVMEQPVEQMKIPLGGGVRAEISFFGGEPTPSRILKLEAFLKLMRTDDAEVLD
ncbi:MAG TPA: hypothetical protein VGM67_07580 [Gemmatimonadaceae bacterium]|jgi:hypothetical protein